MAHDDYESKVEPATRELNALSNVMLSDLDVDRGGFGWWHGYLDAPRIALTSEYLVASVSGAADALSNAALQCHTFDEQSFADNHWLRTVWRATVDAGKTSDRDFLVAMRRGPRERKRERLIENAEEYFFYHSAQVLDRLAACIIGVAALKTDIVRADWADIEKAITVAAGTTQPKKHALDGPGTSGRAAQDALLATVDTARLAGPDDWMAWILASRNTGAHRARPMRWKVIVHDRGRPSATQTPFLRQPGWPETEAMVKHRGPATGPADLLILEDPGAVMGDLLDLMVTLTRETAKALNALWVRRKSDLTLLVQPGQQWKTYLERDALRFVGTGAPAIEWPTSGAAVRVAPETGRRLRASKIMDTDQAFWE